MAKSKPPFTDDQTSRVTHLRMMYTSEHQEHCDLGVDEIVDIMEEHPDMDDEKLVAEMHRRVSQATDTKHE